MSIVAWKPQLLLLLMLARLTKPYGNFKVVFTLVMIDCYSSVDAMKGDHSTVYYCLSMRKYDLLHALCDDHFQISAFPFPLSAFRFPLSLPAFRFPFQFSVSSVSTCPIAPQGMLTITKNMYMSICNYT